MTPPQKPTEGASLENSNNKSRRGQDADTTNARLRNRVIARDHLHLDLQRPPPSCYALLSSVDFGTDILAIPCRRLATPRPACSHHPRIDSGSPFRRPSTSNLLLCAPTSTRYDPESVSVEPGNNGKLDFAAPASANAAAPQSPTHTTALPIHYRVPATPNGPLTAPAPFFPSVPSRAQQPQPGLGLFAGISPATARQLLRTTRAVKHAISTNSKLARWSLRDAEMRQLGASLVPQVG
uniref:Uncharacterized protein n=1 Tax=Mycena chlorophos TaxID=658473 RepID=A0ABQ0L6F8_MYCCL|nr:predicted protein [Mycena chlorophos]